MIKKLVKIKKRITGKVSKIKKKKVGFNGKKSIPYLKYYKKSSVNENVILYDANDGLGLVNGPYSVFVDYYNSENFSEYKHVWAVRGKDEYKHLKDLLSAYNNIEVVQKSTEDYLKVISSAGTIITNNIIWKYFIKKDNQNMIFVADSTPSEKSGRINEHSSSSDIEIIRTIYQSDCVIFANEQIKKKYIKQFSFGDSYIGCLSVNENLMTNLYKEQGDNFSFCNEFSVAPNKKTVFCVFNDLIGEKAENDEIFDFCNDIVDKLKNSPVLNDYNFVIKISKDIYNSLLDSGIDMTYFIPYWIDSNNYLGNADIIIVNHISEDMKSDSRGKNIYQIKNVNDIINMLEKNIVEKNQESKKNVFKNNYQSLCDEIDNFNSSIPKDNATKKRVLIYGGMFYDGGVSHALFALLNSIDYEALDVTLLIPNKIIDGYLLDEINKNVRVIKQNGKTLVTKYEEFKYSYLWNFGLSGRFGKTLYPENILIRESRRLFGNLEFDTVIDYCGVHIDIQNIILFTRNKRAKRLVWQHTDYYRTLNEKLNDGIKNPSYNPDKLKAVKSIYPLYDKVISCSKSTMDINQKNFKNDGINVEFDYVNNMLNIDRVEEGLTDEKYEINKEQKYISIKNQSGYVLEEKKILFDKSLKNIVSLGRLAHEKNYFVLIKSFYDYLNDYPNSRLYIIGDGKLKDQLLEYISSLNLDKKVILTGRLDNPFPLMSKCDCFVLPSIYEGYPLVVLEARMLKMPIILSDFDTVKSVEIPDGQIVSKKDYKSFSKALKTFGAGEIPHNYKFDGQEYNDSVYKQFLNLL